MQCDKDPLLYYTVTYLTEQHKQPFRNSSHSSYNLPACPTARVLSKALPKKDARHQRYRNTLGVSVLSISHLDDFDIE